MTTTNGTYHIKESEIAYLIDAVDSAFMYLEQNCDGMSAEALLESMGILHNLRHAESGELYWTPQYFPHNTNKLADTEDTDYFD